jgi:hypothetical protein
LQGALDFATFVSTAKKQGWNFIIDALADDPSNFAKSLRLA